MTIRHAILAAAVALATIGPARADGTEPGRGQAVDLGAVSGVAYYTVERDGFHVVATLASPDDDAATPVRVEAVLAPGQSVVLSTPRAAGASPEAVEISRVADALLVRKAPAAAIN